MKKHYKLFILFLIVPLASFANGDKFAHSKQKSIKKTYLVNSDAGIQIDNSYGSISLSTWDEDKIDISVIIKVSGNNQNWVNQKINDITVDINALKSLVSAKTIIGKTSSRSSGNNNNFEINYSIKIPKKGGIKLTNKYGNIVTTDLWSNTDIYCKYGKITLGKLNSTANSIRMEYCNDSSIDAINSGVIAAKYSELDINKVTKLDLTTDYTNTNIQEANAVYYTSKYGSIKIQDIKTLKGTGNYLKIKIGTILDAFKINTKYSDVTIANLKTDVVEITSAYTNISLGYLAAYAFDFDIAVRYANFNYDRELEVISKEETNNSKNFKGYYKSRGVNKINISSDFGNVSLIKKQ